MTVQKDKEVVDTEPQVSLRPEDVAISDLCDNLRIDTTNPEIPPDWQCSFCSGLNPASLDRCGNCGNSQIDSNQNFFTHVAIERAVESAKEGEMSPPAQVERWMLGLAERPTLVKSVLAAAVIACIGGGVWLWNSAHSTTYRVAELRWERAIPTLRYQLVERESWRDQVEGDDVQILSQKRMVRDYENELAEPRKEGKGEAETWVAVFNPRPVYDIRVRYRAKMYLPAQTARVTGVDNQPRWPEMENSVGLDGKPDQLLKGEEHLMVRLEKVDQEDAGPDWVRMTPPLSDFLTDFRVGETLSLRIAEGDRAIGYADDTAIVAQGNNNVPKESTASSKDMKISIREDAEKGKK